MRRHSEKRGSVWTTAEVALLINIASDSDPSKFTDSEDRAVIYKAKAAQEAAEHGALWFQVVR